MCPLQPHLFMPCPSFTLARPDLHHHQWHPQSESESEVAQLGPTLWTPWTVAHQAPPSMGFSRQEYWSGLPFPSPGDLPNPGIKPRSPKLHADALTSRHQGSTMTSPKAFLKKINRVFWHLEGRDQSGRSKPFQGRKATICGSPGQCRLYGAHWAVWVQTYWLQPQLLLRPLMVTKPDSSVPTWGQEWGRC